MIDDVVTRETNEEIKVNKNLEAGAGVSGLLILNENEDRQQNLRYNGER